MRNIITTEKKQLAILVDPDKAHPDNLKLITNYANQGMVDFFLVGGSITNLSSDHVVDFLKLNSNKPVILFPGDIEQIAYNADGILFLSLVSGRNPEYLIGKHVIVAKKLKNSKLTVIPTAYILISSSLPTSVQYISQTQPIPRNKPQIAAATALAAQMLGMKAVYLETGSNANEPVPVDVIREVKNEVSVPVIVGGGIKKPKHMIDAYNAGADIVVIGSAVEENPEILPHFHQTLKNKILEK